MKTPKKISALTLSLLVCSAACLNSQAQSWSGGDIGNSQNWSDGANWAGGTAPTSSSAVVFPDGLFPLSTNAQGVVNNIVQSSTTIASLMYNNRIEILIPHRLELARRSQSLEAFL